MVASSAATFFMKLRRYLFVKVATAVARYNFGGVASSGSAATILV